MELPPKSATNVDNQIRLDVARSLAILNSVDPCDDIESRRLLYRERLTRTLDYVFPVSVTRAKKQVLYYQGLHDVATMFLLGGGPGLAPVLLHEVVTSGRLPYASAGVPLALDVLELMMTLLEARDAQLHAHILASGVAPHWGLSWMITWFSHDVSHIDAGLRLFDAILCGPLLMPVYIAADLLMQNHTSILALDPEDTGPLHQHLKALPARLNGGLAHALVTESVATYGAILPAQLLRRFKEAKPDHYARLQSQWPLATEYHEGGDVLLEKLGPQRGWLPRVLWTSACLFEGRRRRAAVVFVTLLTSAAVVAYLYRVRRLAT